MYGAPTHRFEVDAKRPLHELLREDPEADSVVTLPKTLLPVKPDPGSIPPNLIHKEATIEQQIQVQGDGRTECAL